MSFTFNWAGVQGIQNLTPKDRDQQMRNDAAAWGEGVRGVKNYIENQKYADLLEGRNKSINRVSEIQKEIARLEQRNSFIDQQISQLSGTAVQPLQVESEGGMGWDVNASKALADY